MKTLIRYLLPFLFFTLPVFSQGTVYIVLGSDTAIWEGMHTDRYHNTYRLGLYTDPARNAYRVMDPSFREPLTDSYGTPVKLTWWMMAGNIFRYATNTDVPLPNIMTLHLMKKYHLDAIERFGDELSLHYHTFRWYDYAGDGRYWWNQSQTFEECRDDWEVTLAQFLLEEDVFPVTFRSGWHYMDNGWQRALDEILPFSMHNDWPAKRADTEEPLDNIFDWSLASSEFVPYRVSSENYQLPGDGPGWNVRSLFMGRVNEAVIESVFEQAQNGIDQVAVFWAHLPEQDFLDNIEKINALANDADARYPDVTFRYTTGVEAMQRWLGTDDTIPPGVTLTEEAQGEDVYFVIETDEPIFQTNPFVAVKDIYERYLVLPAEQTGENRWRTTRAVPRPILAKVGTAVTDTAGNLSMEFLYYLPDDIFIDNTDAEYRELSGNWQTTTNRAWGDDARFAVLSGSDPATVRWSPKITHNGYHTVFVQVPEVTNPADSILFTFHENGAVLDSIVVELPIPPHEWVYIATPRFSGTGEISVDMTAGGAGQEGKHIAADVLKISALVRDRDLYVSERVIEFGEVSNEDTVSRAVTIGNRGMNELEIFNIASKNGLVRMEETVPFTVPGMSQRTVPLSFHYPGIGIVGDTLVIESNDAMHPVYAISVTADVQKYFIIIDNEDEDRYSETGTWHTSVTQAYGGSSRYALLSGGPGSSACFSASLPRTGRFDIFYIVPTTENSANNALYRVHVHGIRIDSVYVDQNEGSGAWYLLGNYFIPANTPVDICIIDTGESTAGDVLRADAIKIALTYELTDVAEKDRGTVPQVFSLEQNYPNPFNPSTTIRFSLPVETPVRLEIYNLLGQRVRVLIADEVYRPGTYSVVWNGLSDNLLPVSSGSFIYRIIAGGFVSSKQMLYLK
jgi:hypothetical protein